jgi:hypothetical protein
MNFLGLNIQLLLTIYNAFIKTGKKMWLFEKKDKNKLNNQFISDYLIENTLKLMGAGRDEVSTIFNNQELGKENEQNSLTVFSKLNNGCILGISLENNKVFKINIWLNNKPSKADLDNLSLFEMTHKNEYYLCNLLDNSFVINNQTLSRHMIGFESKIF